MLRRVALLLCLAALAGAATAGLPNELTLKLQADILHEFQVGGRSLEATGALTLLGSAPVRGGGGTFGCVRDCELVVPFAAGPRPSAGCKMQAAPVTLNKPTSYHSGINPPGWKLKPSLGARLSHPCRWPNPPPPPTRPPAEARLRAWRPEVGGGQPL